MNTKIIGSIVLGSVLLVMQPTAMAAGQCMAVGVDTGDGFCPQPRSRTALTGTEDFRDAISQAIGYAAGARDSGCTGSHITVKPAKKGLYVCKRPVPPRP